MESKEETLVPLRVPKWVNMKFDYILDHLGQFGQYQKFQYLLLCIPGIFTALHKLAWVFLGASPFHRCILPIENDTYSIPKELLNRTIPYDTNLKQFDQCNIYRINYSNPYWESETFTNETIPCHSWKYDHTYFKSSAVMQYNLVCELGWMKTLGQSIFMVGVLLGSIIFGYLSDKYGRQRIFFISIMMMTGSGCFAAFMPDFFSFIAVRTVIGATTSGVFLVAFVLGMELVGPKYRIIAGICIQFFFAFGYVLTSLAAYLIWDWKYLQVAISLPSIIFIFYWWFVPESARWLMTQKRFNEAEAIIRKAAKTNKVTLPDYLFEEEDVIKEENPLPVKKASLLDLFRTPNMCKKSLNILYNWLVNSLVYYGLSLNTSNLGWNPYVTFAISGAVEIPAYVMCIFVMDKVGRRIPLCGCMIIGGLSLLATFPVPNDYPGIIITLSMLGKFTISASYAIIYVFSAELFPTPVRNVGVGLSSMCARIGGISAPFLVLLADIQLWLPPVIFGALALTAGFFALFLPETNNKPLPETIAEGENFGRKCSEENNCATMEPFIVQNGDISSKDDQVSTTI